MTPTPTDPREAEIAQLREQVAVLQSQVDNADLNFDQIRMIERGKTRELQSTNSKLAAEVERLKTACEKEFQSVEQLSGENMKLAAEIAELKALLSSYHFDTSNPPAVVKAIIEGNIKDRAELETAKLTLFKTEKRLDDKLHTALAELDAARKERDEQIEQEQARFQSGIERVYLEYCPDATIDGGGCDSGDPLDFTISELRQAFNHITDKRDTALAAKDAAEKALVRIASMEPHQHSSTCMLMHKIANEATAALTPAPTQEPPACLKCFGTGWIRQVGGKLKCECKQNPTGDDDGLFDNIPDFQAIGGVTISNETVGIIPTATTPKEASPDVSALGAEAASHPSTSPADVPSEGRGELLPFNLSDALAGKPVVTRDGQSVRYEDCVNNIIFAWIGDARMMWWDNGKFTHRSEPDPLDLFMLPPEGSGA